MINKDCRFIRAFPLFLTLSITSFFLLNIAYSLPVHAQSSGDGNGFGAPATPEGFEAESGLVRSVILTWEIIDNKEVVGYIIYRSQKKKGPFEIIADIKGNKKNRYHDRNGGSLSKPNLEDSSTYYYAISSLNKSNDESKKSDPLSATTSGPPSTPTGFEGTGWQAFKVPLNWDVHPDKNVRGYIIYRSKEDEKDYSRLTEIKDRKDNKYIDGGVVSIFSLSDKKKLNSAQVYFYKIQAFNWANSKSKMSEPISVMTRPIPAPLENVKATSNRPREIPISWRKSPDIKIKTYQIFRSNIEDGNFKKIGEIKAEIFHYLDNELKDNMTYFYKIRAIDIDKLKGEFSEIVSASTKKLPETVLGLKWIMEEGKAVIRWDKSKEIDIESYIVYRKGLFGWRKAGSATENIFVIPNLKRGDSDQYSVSAIDADKLESKRSDALKVNIQ